MTTAGKSPWQRLACALSTLLCACALAPLEPGIPKIVQLFPIAPFERHEECARLEVGDRLDYHFEAQLPVSFSIGYDDGGSIVSPISREDVTEAGGIFQPKLATIYCLRWEAGQRGAIVDYRIRLLRERPP